VRTIHSSDQLRSAVTQMCPEVASSWRPAVAELDCEHAYWSELACCLLSSQVPYAMAQAATQALGGAGLLESCSRDEDVLASIIERELSTPITVDGVLRKYRFPRIKARQLASTRVAIQLRFGSLSRFKLSMPDAHAARAWLVAHAPGIGPKQASMYLRNAHGSLCLAVLDRHIVNYMDRVGIGRPRAIELSRLPAYRRWEDVLCDHAQRLGYSVGMLDVAVWLVMRAACSAETRS
jgi:N-glycosylase/DNA lyase